MRKKLKRWIIVLGLVGLGCWILVWNADAASIWISLAKVMGTISLILMAIADIIFETTGSAKYRRKRNEEQFLQFMRQQQFESQKMAEQALQYANEDMQRQQQRQFEAFSYQSVTPIEHGGFVPPPPPPPPPMF